MASLIEWKKDNVNTPTMGVRMVRGGQIECVYNSEFCDELDVQTLMAIVKHEIEHIVRLHITRLGQDRMPRQWNYACDAIVNGKDRHPHIDDLPKETIRMPNDWPDEITTEEAYDKIVKNKMKVNVKCPMCGGSGKSSGGKGDGDGDGDGDGKGDGKGGGKGGGKGDGKGDGNDPNCPMCGGEGNEGGGGSLKGSFIDDHSIWKGSTVSKDEARQIVKDMVDQATTKAAGSMPGHLQDAIKRLEKPIHNWKHEFRQLIGRKAGGKRTTFARRSRRHNHFGIPGKSSHASIPLTVWVDTSGSMSRKDLEVVFTEIEAMSQRFKVRVGQFDHGVQDPPRKYHRGDWKKIKILGRGGTCFHAPISYMLENRDAGDVNIILTDGYAPFPEKPPFYIMWAIVNKEVDPPWGHTVRITRD